MEIREHYLGIFFLNILTWDDDKKDLRFEDYKILNNNKKSLFKLFEFQFLVQEVQLRETNADHKLHQI